MVATKYFRGERGLVESLCYPRGLEFGEDCFHFVVDCFKPRDVWKSLQEMIGGNMQVRDANG